MTSMHIHADLQDRINASIKKRIDKVAPTAERYRDVAAINERYCAGDQWDAVVYADGVPQIMRNQWGGNDDDLPRISVNKIQNVKITWTALLNQDRSTVHAAPHGEEPEHLFQSEVANKIIEALIDELDATTKTHDAIMYACEGGTGGLKICLDKKRNVTWTPITIFDFYIDQTPNYKDARWVIFDDVIDEDEAWNYFKEVGIEREPEKDVYRNAMGESREGVRVREYWQRPCREYPKGLFAFVVDNEVIEWVEEYPYTWTDDNGEQQEILPIVLMKARNLRGSPFGLTNLTSCVPLQRGLNESVAREMMALRLTSKLHLMLPESMRDQMDLTQNQYLYFKKSEERAAGAAKFLQPAEPPKTLFEMRNYFDQQMNQVMGLSEITAGQKTRSISGRAIDNTVELDKQKNADAIKSKELMVHDAWLLTFLLIQKFYSNDRKMRISDGQHYEVLSFNGADLDGVDLRLEPASEIDTLQTAKGAATAEKVKSGIASPMDLARVTQQPGYLLSRRTSEEIIQSYLATGAIDMETLKSDGVNLEVFMYVLQKHKALARNERRKQDWIKLHSLENEVRSLLQQSQDKAPVTPQQEQPQDPQQEQANALS